jgi:hypothetical protein
VDEEILFFNGIDADTGEYVRPPRHLKLEPRLGRRPREVTENVNPKDLAETGWGVLFAEDDDLASPIRDAMKPLLDHRHEQATRICERRYRELTAEQGYQVGERKLDFLARHKVGPGPVDPDQVPYYLLIVGSPEKIPFPFQYLLDIPYGVGRLHFDTLEEYERYALSVVEAETRPPARPRRTALFGACHDPATEVSLYDLLQPLHGKLRLWTDWELSTSFGKEATKDRLGTLLGGKDTPAILFTAGHGLVFNCDSPNQRAFQGALLCQDWPGHGERAKREHYFAGGDLDESCNLRGMISFHFACYSAGTPLEDDVFLVDGKRRRLAPAPFISHLPQCMLAHPNGGALAVVGHVDQACQSSFLWETAGSQVQVFADVLLRLQEGYPVAAAMEPLTRRYTEILADLNGAQEEGRDVSETDLEFLRIASRDARNYVVVGDPAVRLPFAPEPDVPRKRVTRG